MRAIALLSVLFLVSQSNALVAMFSGTAYDCVNDGVNLGAFSFANIECVNTNTTLPIAFYASTVAPIQGQAHFLFDGDAMGVVLGPFCTAMTKLTPLCGLGWDVRAPFNYAHSSVVVLQDGTKCNLMAQVFSVPENHPGGVNCTPKHNSQ
eukprot:TRINITY_DN6127_c0_g1_i2.p1 TRINITY_DN6127_c0_g1~~TRINITY_DN6127_c0_g1_i2.p1  ORF type:complete len:158 (-),score=22.20 TRINITY_DN6127_c0_g1_i2:38-487(-)